MLVLNSAELDALLIAWLFPLARVLGFMGTAPIVSNQALPRRVRLTIGLAITFALVSTIPRPDASFQPGSWVGIGIFIQQIVIGVAMGLSMRIVMSAVDIAGDLMGLQMGLSFATFFDPNTSAQTAVISQFLSLLSSLTFLALNGHLLLIDVLAHSFELAPIGASVVTGKAWSVVAGLGSIIFVSGLLIALPVIAALLVTNLALAVLTRTAPQLNLFSLGFPITNTVGYLVIIASLGSLTSVLQRLYDSGFDLLAVMIKGFGGH